MTTPLPTELPATSYQVEVLRTRAALEAVADAYQGFLDATQNNRLKWSWPWLMAWLDHFPPDTLMFTVVKDASGQWVGVLPFEVSRFRIGRCRRFIKRLGFIGSNPGLADGWLMSVRAPHAPEPVHLAAFEALAHYQHQWDMVELSDCRDLLFLQTLQQTWKKQYPCGSTLTETDKMVYMQVPESVEVYETKVRSNRIKKMVKSAIARLKHRYTPVNLTLAWPTDADTMAQLAQNHIAYWQDKGIRSEFARYPQLKDFYVQLLQQSGQTPGHPLNRPLWLNTILINDELMAWQLGHSDHDSTCSILTSYLAPYTNFRPGILQFDRLVQETITSGRHCFNFGRGMMTYKTYFTDLSWPLYTLRLFRCNAAPLLFKLDQCLMACRNQIKSLIHRAAPTPEAPSDPPEKA